MGYRETMGMPMRAFWHFNGCVPRLEADAQKERLIVASSSQNSEATQQLHEQLEKSAPNPIRFTAEAQMEATGVDRDESGFELLRSMAS